MKAAPSRDVLTSPPAQPATLVDVTALPPELTARPQWVLWRLEDVGRPKLAKVPYSRRGVRANATDSATWRPFAEVWSEYEADADEWAGVGYVFSADDPFVGIDLDKCREPRTGALTREALAIVQRFASYTEASASGTGIHIIVAASTPEPGRRTDQVECYAASRYFTCTGLREPGTPATIEPRADVLRAWWAETFPPRPSGELGSLPAAAERLSDADVLAAAFRAANGAKFTDLWAGRWERLGYASQSDADLALCGLLAFYTGGAVAQVDRLFRQSGLYRPKWDERRGMQTYGQRTLAYAVSGLGETYTPSGERSNGTLAADSAETSVSIERQKASAPLVLPFRTARQLRDASAEEPEWIIAALGVAVGTVTELDGKPKAAGKTTLLTQAVHAVLHGLPFLGQATQASPVVFLTEQGDPTIKTALGRAGLLDHEDLHILTWADVRGLSWAAVVQGATTFALSIGARLLIVDTLGRFTGLVGDAENTSGAAIEAMGHLHAAAAQGLAVIAARHERKAPGEVGDTGRGSNQFTGDVDTVWALRRAQGSGRGTVRVLHGLSRFDDMPETLTIELTPTGYIALGDAAAYALAEAKTLLLAKLPRDQAGALPLDTLLEGTDVKRTMAQDAIKALVDAGHPIERIGEGKKNDPYRYWCAPQMLSAAPKTEVSAETNPRGAPAPPVTIPAPPAVPEYLLPQAPAVTAESVAQEGDEEEPEWRG
jgi:putative DNA primase/helicase